MATRVKKQSRRPKAVPGAGIRAEKAINYAMMRAVSQADGYEFSAQTIYDWIKDEVPKSTLSKIVQKRMGVLFKKMARLGLIYPSGRVLKSTRENHDGKLINIWIVGKAAANGPLNVGTNPPENKKSDPLLHNGMRAF